MTGEDYMRRALRLARRAQGTTSPNPPVGAVLVRDGAVVGEGWTQPPGGAHAEIMALRAAGEAARGATLYVTLEPCVHHGRTPPCVDALVAAGIAEVHLALIDGNPQVAGRGLEALEQAGIGVHVDERYGTEALELSAAHLKFVTTGKPLVTAKFAASLDGRIATRTGHSRWITGVRAREHAHRVRASLDAILAGSNTIVADDPELTARPGGRLHAHQPLRVVLDSGARTPPQARVLAGPGGCLVAVGEKADPAAAAALERAGAEVLWCPGADGRVDLVALLAELARRGRINLLVEGGGILLGAFFDAGLVDRVMAYIAPLVIGGREAPVAVGGAGPDLLAGAWRIVEPKVRRLGPDLLVEGAVVHNH